jgi:hypothetical protein
MYGTAAGVAALSSMWTRYGEFFDADLYVDATVPSLAQVENWLVQVTSSLNIALADEGFVVPVTDADVLPSLDHKVEAVTKDLCDFSHGAGRFFTTQEITGGASPMLVIEKELREWVTEHSIGMEAMGVPKHSKFIGRHVATFDVL